MTRRRLVLSGMVVVVLAAVFFAPELFGGRVAVTSGMDRWLPWGVEGPKESVGSPSHNPDCNLSYYPRRAVLHAAWKDGEVPLWNPYSFGGTPFLADVQAGVLYPPNWALFPMDPARQLGLFLFLHAAWGGLGMLLLLRHRVPPLVALSAAAAFCLNEYFAKHFGQPTFLAAAAWTPWFLAAALSVFARPGLRESAWLGMVGAFLFLAGQPQTFFHTIYATLLVLIVLYAFPTDSAKRPRLAPTLGAFAAAGVLAFLLSAAQLLPTVDLASRSARASLPFATVASGSVHPVEAIRFLVPNFFGSPVTGDEWSLLFPRGDGFYLRHQLNTISAATPVFLLALWAVANPRTRRDALPWAAVFVAFAGIAFAAPPARFAHAVLPGFSFSRMDRAGYLLVVAQFVLAAYGAADLLRADGRWRRVAGVGTILLAAGGWLLVRRAGADLPLLLGAGEPLPVEFATTVLARTTTAALFAAGTGVAFLLGARPLVAAAPFVLALVQLYPLAAPYRGDRLPSEVFVETPSITALRSVLEDEGMGGGRFLRFGRHPAARAGKLSGVLPPSTNVPFRLRDLQGYNALAERRVGDALETALGEELFTGGIWSGRRILAPERASSMEHPVLDALSVRAAVGTETLSARGWREIKGGGFRVFVNEEALPRARLVARAHGVSELEMESVLAEGAFAPGCEAYWVGVGSVGEEGSESDEAGTVRMMRDSWNEVRLVTEAPAERLLVLADTYSPGWRAEIDGDDAPVLPVYGVVRGVVVPPGEHEVRMVYNPVPVRAGRILSIAGLLAAGALLCIPRRRVASVAACVVLPFLLGACGGNAAQEAAKPAPVFVLGFDGLDAGLVEEMEAEGLLPNFARLRAEGAAGGVRSTLPMISPPAWTTATTGVEPSAHGVWGFWVVGADRSDPRGAYIDATHRLAPTVWQDLASAGRTVGVVNVPVTCPPDSVRGFMVAGFPYPEGAPLTWPPSLADSLAGAGYPRDELPGLPPPGQELSWLADLRAKAEARREIGLDLLFDASPDLSFIVFTVPDRIQHHLWKFHDSAHPRHDPGAPEPLRTAVRDIYAWCDEVLGEVRHRLPNKTALVVLADHGFGPAYRGISRDALLAGIPPEVAELNPGSRSLFGGEFYLMRKDAEARALFVRHLREVRGPRGNLLFREVHDLAGTPGTGFGQGVGPDVCAIEAEGFLLIPWDPAGPVVVPIPPKVFSGYHRRVGYFAATGPPFAPGARAELNLADISPTVLHLLGEAVPGRYTGRVADHLFRSGCIAARPVVFSGTPTDGLRRPGESRPSGTTGNDRSVEEQLRSLGYVQ
ncbi:MAG: alkaline phosphatase family protein [Gemmatimonadota bacterium]|nr:alkaline phosphatase family protein [Gemmatimonadota bacterium]